MATEEYARGKRAAYRECIAWLHDRAEKMNDPHAKAVLNSAAFSLGNLKRHGGIVLTDGETP